MQKNKIKFYNIVEHTADIGIRVWAEELKELYENAGKALFDLIAGIENLSGNKKNIIEIKGEGKENLLFNFLNELIFEFDARRRLYSDFNIIEFNNGFLKIAGKWESYNKKKHTINYLIKAVSLHLFSIYKRRNKFYCKVIFDV